MFNAKSNKPQRDLIIHMLLAMFLGKIWLWPWVYQTACNLKQIKNDYSRSPGGQLLMFILVPFYSLYWFYKSGKIISKYSSVNGLPMKIAGLCCVVSLFSNAASSIIMQMEICKLEELKTAEDENTNKKSFSNNRNNEKTEEGKNILQRQKPDMPIRKETKEEKNEKTGMNELFEDYWVCGKCQRTNANERVDCWACGNKR